VGISKIRVPFAQRGPIFYARGFFFNPSGRMARPAVGSFPGFSSAAATSVIDNASRQGRASRTCISSAHLVMNSDLDMCGRTQHQTAPGRTAAAVRAEDTCAVPLSGAWFFPASAFNYSGQLSGTSEILRMGCGDPNLNIENRFRGPIRELDARPSRLEVRRGCAPAAVRYGQGHAVFGQPIYGATF